MSRGDQLRKAVQRAKRALLKARAERALVKQDKQASRARRLAHSKKVGALYRLYGRRRAVLSKYRAERQESYLRYSTYVGGGRVTPQTKRVLDAARARGWSGSTNGARSCLRTYEEQNQLYQDYLAGKGAPAFPPWGPSAHLIKNLPANRLHACDVSDAQTLVKLAGWSRPYLPREPWHCEP